MCEAENDLVVHAIIQIFWIFRRRVDLIHFRKVRRMHVRWIPKSNTKDNDADVEVQIQTRHAERDPAPSHQNQFGLSDDQVEPTCGAFPELLQRAAPPVPVHTCSSRIQRHQGKALKRRLRRASVVYHEVFVCRSPDCLVVRDGTIGIVVSDAAAVVCIKESKHIFVCPTKQVKLFQTSTNLLSASSGHWPRHVQGTPVGWD
jgi:hypothetical protein